MRRVALVSAGRVSDGIYQSIIDEIIKNKNLEYMYVVTGAHLLNEFGNTIKTIKDKGIKVYEMPIELDGEEENKQVKNVGRYILAITSLFEKNRPDIILAQGDRGIALATALVGAHLLIPVAHMHGGEISRTVDEYTRHAITHYSHIHFVATEKSAERLRLLGQGDSRIFVVGGTAIDYVLKQDLITRNELEKEFALNFDDKIGVILQHPVPEEKGLNGINFKQI